MQTSSLSFLLVVVAAVVSMTMMAVMMISAETPPIELPRHIPEVTEESQIAPLLFESKVVVAGIATSLAHPEEFDTAVMEAFIKSSLDFQRSENHFNKNDVKFIAMNTRTTVDGVEGGEIPKSVATWITKKLEMHRTRGGVQPGILILKRAEGAESDRLWKDWNNKTDDLDVPADALPVDVLEVLAPGDGAGIEEFSARITRRVRCMVGPSVRELVTESDLEDFLINTCSPSGVSVVAWPRKALWPYSQKVEQSKLQQLHYTQRALATLAVHERPYASFAWIDDDSPIVSNMSVLAFVNGQNAPAVAYICDEKCQKKKDPLSLEEITLKLYPFNPFKVLHGIPKAEMPEFIQVGMSDFYAEVLEIATNGSITAIELGIDAQLFPSPECETRIKKGDRVAITLLGESKSFDRKSKPTSLFFYRSLDLIKGDTITVGKKHNDLPPQLGKLGDEEIFSKLCVDPAPTRAQVILRSNRHYNLTDLPPRIQPYATLHFYLEVQGKISAFSGVAGKNRGGGGDSGEAIPEEEEAEDVLNELAKQKKAEEEKLREEPTVDDERFIEDSDKLSPEEVEKRRVEHEELLKQTGGSSSIDPSSSGAGNSDVVDSEDGGVGVGAPRDENGNPMVDGDF